MTTPLTTTAATELVYAAVRPWLHVFQVLAPVQKPFHVRHGNDNEDKIVWLAPVRLPLAAVNWTRILDALHVLALLQRLRADLWRLTVSLLWPEHAPQWPLSTELGIDFYPNEARDCKLVDTHLQRAIDPTTLILATDLMRTWIALVTAVGGEKTYEHVYATTCHRVPVRICVASPVTHNMNYDIGLLHAIVGLVQRNKAIHDIHEKAIYSPSCARACSSLHILAVHLEAEKLAVADPSIVFLHELRDTHVRVSILSPIRLFGTTNGIADRVPSALHRLCRVTPPRPQNAMSSGLVAMRISTDMAPRLVDALLSAAQHSQSLRTVHLLIGTKLAVTIRPHNLRWVAYALFSRHATHRITTLEMCVTKLLTSDVDVMGELLVAADPFAVLMGVQSSAEQVVVDKVILHSPAATSSLTSSGGPPLRVIQRSHGDCLSTRVLLPGWGSAWLPSGHDHAITPFEEPTFPGHPHRLVKPIPNVALTDMALQSRGAVSALLALIGAGIQTLSVSAKSDVSVDSAWCVELLDACPSLEHLQLSGGGKFLIELQPFIDGYVSGRCRMQTLSVCSVTAEDASRALLTLSDPTHPMAHTIRMWACGVQFKDGLQCKSFLEATLRMLLVNRRLRHVRIAIAHAGVRDEDYASLKKSCLAYLNDKLQIPMEPLSRRCKAAFLSGLPWSGDKSRQGQVAVATVFEFAAQPGIKRCVEITRGRIV